MYFIVAVILTTYVSGSSDEPEFVARHLIKPVKLQCDDSKLPDGVNISPLNANGNRFSFPPAVGTGDFLHHVNSQIGSQSGPGPIVGYLGNSEQ
eukprot:UN03727